MSHYTDADRRFDAWVTGNWGEDSVSNDEPEREGEPTPAYVFHFSRDIEGEAQGRIEAAAQAPNLLAALGKLANTFGPAAAPLHIAGQASRV